MDQTLQREGCNVRLSGKLDWTTGGHSENVFLNARTMYARLPYNVSVDPGAGRTSEIALTTAQGATNGARTTAIGRT